ncbi:MAG: type VI secretion system lipoprotein TssJ [Nannocystaceae bacterium]
MSRSTPGFSAFSALGAELRSGPSGGRVRGPRAGLGALVLGLGPLAAGGGCKPPCDAGDLAVQVLVHPGDPLSPDDQGRSLPTTVHLYQLKTAEPIGKVSLDALVADAKGALGEGYVGEETFVVWPEKDDVRTVTPKGDAHHLLLVAEFRRLLGTGWYSTYDIPDSALHEAAVCTARKKKKKPVGPPCFYVTLDQYTAYGSPSGAGFEGPRPLCAPPPWMYEIDPRAQRKAERKRRRQQKGQRIPRAVRPNAPRAPITPSQAGGGSPPGPGLGSPSGPGLGSPSGPGLGSPPGPGLGSPSPSPSPSPPGGLPAPR